MLEAKRLIRWGSACIVGSMALLSGCSAGRPPTAELSQAELAIQEASRQTKAPEYAPLELTTAREQLASAQRAMSEKEYEQARRLAERALANAQLAEAKADAEQSRRAAQELQKSIQALGREAERSSNTR